MEAAIMHRHHVCPAAHNGQTDHLSSVSHEAVSRASSRPKVKRRRRKGREGGKNLEQDARRCQKSPLLR
ncbi:Hypothetical predicted protein [Xyrichtys novacula]|uniref:Uncharacterized protein n=1 Tax=Xyrichtys novacula TaxID=13765 RepID=A0AAV1G2Y1_XYRNO|nr:Hypothetical predicted protein [Xyrichtys novacula]